MNKAKEGHNRKTKRMNRSHFERWVGGFSAKEITTICPSSRDGKTLAEMGWRFITRDDNGCIVKEEDADMAKARILRGVGHVVSPSIKGWTEIEGGKEVQS